ncbi:urea transporter [Pannus brasiliensis CCIBt3594]|uniref:Urea transporter n=1 Tax=Pannus brasiliensis CCIBt3594 TaxID=1427578 RepID=A0AAW9QSQ6_9CHRO
MSELQNAVTESEDLPLQEIISRVLAPNLDSSPPLPWWTGLGTMPSLSQRLAANPVLDFLNATFRGIAQVIFVNNPLSGLLIWLAMMLQAPWMGLLSFLGSASATLAAKALKSNPFMVRDGIYGLNGLLIGAALGFFGQFGNGNGNPAWAIATIVLAALTSVVMETVGLWFTKKFRVSPLGIPFNGVLLPFLFLVAFIPQPFFDLGPAPAPFATGDYDPVRLMQSFHVGLAGVFFSDKPLSIALIMVGVAICTPIGALVAMMGGIMYILAGLLLEAKPDELYLMLWGYNAVLTAVAIGGVFYAPTRLSIALAALCSFLAACLSFLLAPVFSLVRLPVLSVPFAIVTIGCLLLVQKSIPSLVPVALHTVASPEEHRERFLVAKKIIENSRLRLQAAVVGEKHNFLFEDAPDSVKGDLRYVFNAIDRDGNGRVSVAELTGYLQRIGKPLPESEFQRLFQGMDSDGSGKIDFEEFGELLLRHRLLMSQYDRFANYFIPIDENHDDLISADEMNVAMASVGEPPLSKAERLFLRQRVGGTALTWNQFIETLLVI